jgi:acetyl-CoA carboxylase biotin carboxyl carrier protein
VSQSEPDTDLAAICQSIAELARIGHGRLRRIRVRLGDDMFELEWPDSATSSPGPAIDVSGPPWPSTLNGADRTSPAGRADVAGDHARLVRAPLVGTFYHAPEPGAAPFVAPGTLVTPGQQVGIIEAMKLMVAVNSETTGEVTEILVSDGTPVEYDQPLIMLKPADLPGRRG